MKVTFGTIIICYVIALFCYDLLKKLFKKMPDKSWWVWLVNTPWRLWEECKVKKDYARLTKETQCCENCLRKYSRSRDSKGRYKKPECKRFQSKLWSKYTNRFKERKCKDFDRYIRHF